MDAVTIYRIKSGRDKGKWRAEIVYTDRAGAVKDKAFQGKTRIVVENKASDFLRRVKSEIPSDETTLLEACKLFIDSREELRRSPKTIKGYIGYARAYVEKSPLADKPVAQIQNHEIDELIKSVPGKSEPHRVRAFLSAVYKKIVIKNEITEFNRAAAVELAPEPRSSAKILTEPNFKKALDCETCEVRKCFWLFLAHTGKRPHKEARHLMWTHLEERKDGLWAFIPDAKTPAGEGWIPICKTVADVLRGLPRTSMFVFGNPETGQPYGQTYWTDAWRELQDKAGTPRTTPYALRHFFATQKALKTHETVLSKLMGHKDARTTKKYYINAADEAMREAVEE
jgi:integrase